jgi:diguanylate cyclase (GGDEF)-like protein
MGLKPSREMANIALDLIIPGVAFGIFNLIGGDVSSPLAPRSIGAALAAMGLASALLCPCIFFLTSSIAENRGFDLRELVSTILTDIVAVTISVSIAIVLLTFTVNAAYLAFALIPICGFVILGHSALSDSQLKARRIEFLYELGTELFANGSLERRTSEVLQLVADRFEAEHANLIVLPSATSSATIFSSAQGSGTTESRELTHAEVEVLATLSPDRPVLRSHTFAAEAMNNLVNDHNSWGGMAALLRGKELLGMVLLMNPRNYRGRFKADEQDYFATLASQLSIAIENGQFANTLARVSQEKEELAAKALYDPLTGLANRGYMMDKVRNALEKRQRSLKPVAALFVDLDGFKAINDELGHASGDEVLNHVAQTLVSHLRSHDTAGRWGGDEFVLVLEDMRDPVDARLVASRIVQALAEPITLSSGAVARIGASIGVALAGSSDTTADALVENADTAMYVAKERGKGRYHVWSPDDGADGRDTLTVDFAKGGKQSA